MPEIRMKKNLKLLIILNFAFLGAITFLSAYKVIFGKSDWVLGSIAVSVLILILLWYFTYKKTGLWSFAHVKSENMDEREYLQANESLRIAYSVFTIIAIGLFYLFDLLEIKLVGGIGLYMLYFAHILPSSIVGWKMHNNVYGKLNYPGKKKAKKMKEYIEKNYKY